MTKRHQALFVCAFHVPGSLGMRLQYYVCYRSSTHAGCDLEGCYRHIIKLLLRMFSVEAMLILARHKSILISAC